MTTRTIVTSQPDVACDVCERRLLRGEQPDVFVAAGRRLTVCELCTPRAAQEGWMRESDTQSVTLPPTRGRRGRSFLDRLRQVGRPALEPAAEPFDFAQADARPVAAPRRPRPRAVLAEGSPLDWAAPAPETAADAVPVAEATASNEAQALDVFNASE